VSSPGSWPALIPVAAAALLATAPAPGEEVSGDGPSLVTSLQAGTTHVGLRYRFEFVDQVKGGAIPNQFIPAVEKGVRGVLATGFLAGYPLQDLRVIVYDGKSHPVDSKEVAFVSAGRKAFLDALAKARAIVLEPIVNVDIVAPEQKMGDITGELSGHRRHIKGSDAPRPGTVQISTQAPLSEMEQFPARLKSITAGHGSYTLEFSTYEPAPPQLQQKLVSAHRPAAHADD